jgi:hypothetical protein
MGEDIPEGVELQTYGAEIFGKVMGCQKGTFKADE